VVESAAAGSSEDEDPLISVPDYEGTQIVCTVVRWTSKIEANHPELVGWHELVADILQSPEIVLQDRDYGNRKHHIRQLPDGLYLKVVTEYRYDRSLEGVLGRVVTAFMQSRLREGDQPLYVNARR
jgi:hypothetical protein